MKLPKVVEDLTVSFERLPGIGRRTAQRLAFYLLRVPQRDLDFFGKSLVDLKRFTKLCRVCHNLTGSEECSVCEDLTRDRTQICVVESFQDVIAIEKSGSYRGLYHVLHGSISPLNNVGPEELYIDTLLERISGGKIAEIILATNTSLEGEATALYIADRISDRAEVAAEFKNIKVNRIGRGLPTGVELEYADDETLHQALATRRAV
ncbi:MAG: Recombination protein RecR [Microgenomates group bacterium GW2011_GWF2_47_9]|nr:MAG: Recombination protein RecR [Microgenomates group bacterium GW2011_GWF2_47_9]